MYYATFEESVKGMQVVYIRQEKFRKKMEQGIDDPYDAVLVARTVAEAREIADRLLVGHVDWSKVNV